MGEIAEVKQRIRAEITASESPELLEAYFRRDDHRFAGELFNTLEPNEPYSIGAADLLAVGFLDESFRAEAAWHILAEQREFYEAILYDIPPDIDIWHEQADLSDDSQAARAWNSLVAVSGVGAVRAGKLLARKRPRLIPIWDSVVDEALQVTRGRYWVTIQSCWRDESIQGTGQDRSPALALA